MCSIRSHRIFLLVWCVYLAVIFVFLMFGKLAGKGAGYAGGVWHAYTTVAVIFVIRVLLDVRTKHLRVSGDSVRQD